MKTLSQTRPWMGRWLLAVAALHTLFGLLVFTGPLRQLLRLGLFNAVGADPLLSAVTWFLLFGAPLALLGQALSLLERRADVDASSLRPLGWGLLALGLLGIVLMPASGFWLLLPVVWALLRSVGR
jgi:cobalamin biosynthesis protein CobD/CbiB